MDSRKELFFAVTVVLIVASPLTCKAYDDYAGLDMGMAMGGDQGGYGLAMGSSVQMSQQSYAPPSCAQPAGNDCTCTCIPRQQQIVPPQPRPCPVGTIRNMNGYCEPLSRPTCSICNICTECVDQRVEVKVKACLQMHANESNASMCLQAAGVSSHTARNLVNARKLPGFRALL